ncbi:S1/P1 nuclease [Shewanella sp. 202IG2-18]|uniref:S1/P1 nuclease n=1 Tax=Parashewanella hymeniacidonis TaxID=2807618 RepID=UPI001960FA14|nr:S1/P1 nuclease [Parashewanella hymeniacidonis]MBM7071339.1 S1/P1 nuclease [Parashewanella hymeniacidonis]
MKKVAIAFVCAATVCSITNNAEAFGRNGHRIVAHIAQMNLSPQAKAQLLELTKGVPLARLSTWSDEIKSDKNWRHANPWHYINAEKSGEWESISRNPKGDILEALDRFEKQLSDKSLSDEKRWQALAFITHLVGDLHQPLHVSHKHDRGGGTIKVSWFGDEKYNFHQVWDTLIIEHQQLSYKEYVDFMPISINEKQQWIKGNYSDWADESIKLRDTIYDYKSDENNVAQLGYGYIYKHRDEVELRMKQAGIRLADKLNKIFEANSSSID